MLPKAFNLLLIVLLSSALTNGIRRKSKIDLPIANAADAPINDNIAQPSEAQQLVKNDEQSVSVAVTSTEKPVSSITTPAAASGAVSSSLTSDNGANNGENDAIECDPDMIGFEIITGYVYSIYVKQKKKEKKRWRLIIGCDENILSSILILICFNKN